MTNSLIKEIETLNSIAEREIDIINEIGSELSKELEVFAHKETDIISAIITMHEELINYSQILSQSEDPNHRLMALDAEDLNEMSLHIDTLITFLTEQ